MHQTSHSTDPDGRFSGIIADLARPRDLRALPLPALHLVMAMRLCALFERANREPLVELSNRLGSISAATAVLAVVRAVVRCWPETYSANRPCSLALTPDERTLAAMGRAALAGDRTAFGTALDGFVRSEHHDALFDRTVRAVASLQPG